MAFGKIKMIRKSLAALPARNKMSYFGVSCGIYSISSGRHTDGCGPSCSIIAKGYVRVVETCVIE